MYYYFGKKFINTFMYIAFTNLSTLTITGHDTAPGEQSKKYRPLFLDHFDKKEQEKKVSSSFCVLYQL